MMGRDNMLNIDTDRVVSFNTKRDNLTKADDPNVYSSKAIDLVNPNLDKHRIPWGHSPIFYDRYDDSTPRMIVLHYAIAFGPQMQSDRQNVTPADMVSNLVEFKVMFFDNASSGPYAAFIK